MRAENASLQVTAATMGIVTGCVFGPFTPVPPISTISPSSSTSSSLSASQNSSPTFLDSSGSRPPAMGMTFTTWARVMRVNAPRETNRRSRCLSPATLHRAAAPHNRSVSHLRHAQPRNHSSCSTNRLTTRFSIDLSAKSPNGQIGLKTLCEASIGGGLAGLCGAPARVCGV